MSEIPEDVLARRLAIVYVHACRLRAIGSEESPISHVRIRVGSDVMQALKARADIVNAPPLGERTLYGFPVDEAGEGDRIDLVLVVGIP